MWQLLHALKYLHTINVWHRDVKSSNVLLVRNPGHRLAKVDNPSRAGNIDLLRISLVAFPAVCTCVSDLLVMGNWWTSLLSLWSCLNSARLGKSGGLLTYHTTHAAGGFRVVPLCDSGRLPLGGTGGARASVRGAANAHQPPSHPGESAPPLPALTIPVSMESPLLPRAGFRV